MINVYYKAIEKTKEFTNKCLVYIANATNSKTKWVQSDEQGWQVNKLFLIPHDDEQQGI